MSEFESEKLKSLQHVEELDEDEEGFEDEEEDEEDEVEEIEIDTELFASQVLRFPCFADVPRDKEADQLFDIVFNAYEDENLTEEQDHAVEFLLHIQEEDSPFNLSRALEIWGREDRQVFLEILTEISNSIDDE
jgi:hypothetical protein